MVNLVLGMKKIRKGNNMKELKACKECIHYRNFVGNNFCARTKYSTETLDFISGKINKHKSLMETCESSRSNCICDVILNDILVLFHYDSCAERNANRLCGVNARFFKKKEIEA